MSAPRARYDVGRMRSTVNTNVDSQPGSEEAVHRALAAGDPRGALAVLMDLYGDAVYRYCAMLLGDRHQAEDKLQTVFLDAFQALPSFEGRSTFKAWLLGIARHRCFDGIRARARWRRLLALRVSSPADEGRTVGPLIEQVPAPQIEPDSRPDAGLAMLLDDCLSLLPIAVRDIVVLRFRQELSFEEISAISGQRAGTLRVRVCRAVEALRRCLEKKGVAFP
jgi:RNA polymerase sigma-70 factor (ECF subfamily)